MEVPSIFLNRILSEAAKKNASELHLSVGSAPMMRINGKLEPFEVGEIISSEIITKIIENIVTKEEMAKLGNDREIVVVKNLAGNFRFRINIFYQKEMPAISFHYIPGVIKAPADLKLPQVFVNFSKLNSGLLIIAGPYGSGRSTTAASFIEEINKISNKKIVTLEDPMEFIFISKKSLVMQRQIGTDVKTVYDGLDFCLAEDVDLVYVSEIKEEKQLIAAMPLIMELSAGNSLVILEMNADSSIRVLEQVLNAVKDRYSPEAARNNLADILQGVIVQKLLPCRGGGLTLAAEVLINNSATKSLLREGKIYQLENVLQTSKREGMVLLAKAIDDLVQSGEVRREDV